MPAVPGSSRPGCRRPGRTPRGCRPAVRSRDRLRAERAYEWAGRMCLDRRRLVAWMSRRYTDSGALVIVQEEDGQLTQAPGHQYACVARHAGWVR